MIDQIRVEEIWDEFKANDHKSVCEDSILDLILHAQQTVPHGRAEIARAALQGILANPERPYQLMEAASEAVSYADALLAVLKKSAPKLT